MRRMYSTELYDLYKKSIVQYPSTFEELMMLAPKFRNKQADVTKKADHIFMTADKKTISVPGKNKDSGRYDRVESEIWDKLTKEQQETYKSLRRDQNKADRAAKRKKVEAKTDSAMVTSEEYSDADWDVDGETVMMTMG